MGKVVIPPWQASFGWLWFNEKEIFDYTDEQIEEHVKSYRDQGINIIIGFSVTHFRMAYHEEWDRINATIAKYARACHKFGMLYVEHHSCHLVWHPKNENEEREVQKYFESCHTDPSRFRGFLEGMRGDSDFFGKYKMSDFYQIAGNTGKYGDTRYAGYGMCFNNPYYREVYFDYLESLYKCGIDGLMTDDVQFFGNDPQGRWNACTCEHCRRLFKQETGYELPPPEKWDSFYNNYSDPVFTAWKQFKVDSTTRFQRDVTAHFQKLGYDFIRPNYISEIVRANITAYPFEKCADLWDYIFQENCSFYIIKDSYPMFAIEAIHRFAMARGRGVPSMSMFYPCSQSAADFSFALAKAWGQLYTKSRGTFDAPMTEKHLRDFESEYIYAFTSPKKRPDLAFLFSPSTRDLTASANDSMARLVSWMQASYFAGLSTDLVFEWDSIETMSNYSVIAAVSCEMLSDEDYEKMLTYVQNGGKLIVVGSFAALREDGSSRENALVLPEGEYPYGKGSFVRLPVEACAEGYCYEIYQGSDDGRVAAQASLVEKLRATGGRALSDIVGRRTLETETQEDVYASYFETERGLTLHFVNVADTVNDGGTTDHRDELTHFVAGAEKMEEISVSCVCDFAPKRLVFASYECGEKELAFRYDGRLNFSIPAGTFAGYGIVIAEK
ncbi:MAG: hypothetical protein PUB08_04880 [Firmicutes bacterium]|nr:hypothetical protein [Bacillota bacterium]